MKGHRHLGLVPYRLLLAALFVLFAVSSQAEKIADLPQPVDYVSDFAHVLSTDAVAKLDNICSQLDHTQANAKIAVVTIHSLDGDDSADYANQLEDHWKMGDKNHGQNRLAMVLLAVDDHKYRIEVGYGLEGILNDAKVGDIGREMVPDLKAGDYDGALLLATDELARVIAADANVTLTDEPAVEQPAPVHHSNGRVALRLIIIAIVIALYLLRVLGSWGLFGLWGMGLFGSGRGYGGGGFGGGGGGGGGGFSGFGGGGGGFGGGGAGGSW
jgi:uncharacterized protein